MVNPYYLGIIISTFILYKKYSGKQMPTWKIEQFAVQQLLTIRSAQIIGVSF
jgi:hypothetical protein